MAHNLALCSSAEKILEITKIWQRNYYPSLHSATKIFCKLHSLLAFLCASAYHYRCFFGPPLHDYITHKYKSGKHTVKYSDGTSL